MPAEFHNLEMSLKEFLTEVQNDSYNSKSTNFYKYNNLRIYMDIKKNKNPHFIVRVGISESIYDLLSCERLQGGLGTDERYIHRWFEKTGVKSELQNAWQQSQKVIMVQMKNEIDEFK